MNQKGKGKKKAISLKLSQADIEFLDSLGGKTQGIELLIAQYKKGEADASAKKSIEERFMERIILPLEPHLRELYSEFLITFLRRGGGMGSLDFYENSLCSATGFDPKTVRKMFRKLNHANFIKDKGFLFRPTIRLIDKEAANNFEEILKDYALFVQSSEQYSDWISKVTKEDDSV